MEFVISEVKVEGAASLPNVAALTSAFIGQSTSVAVLTDIASAIAKDYIGRDVAYYTAEIADLDATVGRVTVRVLEAYVTDIKIGGNAHPKWARRIRRIMAPLLTQRPLRRSSYERVLVQISGQSGLDVDATMHASDNSGGIALHFVLKRRSPSLTFGFNNYGNELVGADTLEAVARWNDLATVGDEATLYYSTPTNLQRNRYASASYSLPLDDGGTALRINAGVLRTRIFDGLLRGHAVQGGVVLSRPLLQRFGRTVTGAIGFDFINVDNALLGYRLTDDHTRSVRASLSYREESARHLLEANISISRGLAVLDSRVIEPLAEADFSKVNFRVDYTRQIDKRMLLRLKGMSQISGDRLPPAEQFAAGGPDFGRALSSGLITGDKGVAASAELAVVPDIAKPFAGTEIYGFVDGVSLRYANRGPFEGYDIHTSSAGAGVRLKLKEKATLDMGGAMLLSAPYPELTDTWRFFLTARLRLGE